MKKVRVLIVDDSAFVRKVLSSGLSKDKRIEVIATARHPYEARDLLINESPDVITLDVEMPKMDGVSFLKKFMPVKPTPTVMISSLTEEGKRITIEALEAGAVDIIEKPKTGLTDAMPLMLEDICDRVVQAASVDVARYKNMKLQSSSTPLAAKDVQSALEQSTDKVIAIGASTGGVEALARILPLFPPATPGIVIVQHMPAGFTESFAKRLNSLSAMTVKEARSGDRIMTGQVLIAPGGEKHMEVKRSGGQYLVQLVDGPPVCQCRPAVDILFDSVAKYVGANAVAAILTGMGKDGTDGIKSISEAGGSVIVQDEKSSVVYGMPKAAWLSGFADSQHTLMDMPMEMLKAL